MKSRLVICAAAIGIFFVVSHQSGSIGGANTGSDGVDPASLTGKMIFGYQGWFECPGDAASEGWRHWLSGKKASVDMLPDITELDPAERCATEWTTPDHQPTWVFSSQNRRTVERHFQWMKDYGLDGVALQRFATHLQPALRQPLDRVLANVRAAAESTGRVFFLMYDLSGMTSDTLPTVADDWARLEAGELTASPAYQRHRGRPVLALWGLGFTGRPITPDAAKRLLQTLRDQSAPYGGVTFLGGVPGGWRIHRGDGAADSAWDEVYRSLDIISPWTVGRYVDDAGADAYRRTYLEPDLAETRRLRLDYMPVIFPGFSWANLMIARNQPDKALSNQIPRRCGRFYWRQVYNAISAGTSMIYGAMFDEVDEGTAMFKVLADRRQLPAAQSFVTLDADGCALPSDWYLQLAGKATGALRSRRPVSPDLPIVPPR